GFMLVCCTHGCNRGLFIFKPFGLFALPVPSGRNIGRNKFRRRRYHRRQRNNSYESRCTSRRNAECYDEHNVLIIKAVASLNYKIKLWTVVSRLWTIFKTLAPE